MNPFPLKPMYWTTVNIKRLTETAKLPTRATPCSAGYDLYADETVSIPGQGQATVGTGIAMKLPEGWCGQIWPRSGLATKGLTRDAGLIDFDYTGEIKVVLVNRNLSSYTVQKGDRIAQLVLTPSGIFPVIEVDELPDTERGADGFGSSGI